MASAGISNQWQKSETGKWIKSTAEAGSRPEATMIAEAASERLIANSFRLYEKLSHLDLPFYELELDLRNGAESGPVREINPMLTILCALSALTVAWTYYVWRNYHTELIERERTLRQRVAYMLWVTARVAS